MINKTGLSLLLSQTLGHLNYPNLTHVEIGIVII